MDRRSNRLTMRTTSTILIACVLLVALTVAHGARTRLRTKIFGSTLTPMDDRISSSDPANNPMTSAQFLSGQEGDSAFVQSWTNSIEEEPLRQKLDQEVLMPSQIHQRAAQQQQQPSFLEQSQQWVEEGHHASDYEPHDWPAKAITPDPYQHLTHRQGGGSNDHNNIEGALGVQSAAIPWDYRHYSGNLNSHRKAEPLIYTPLVIAKDHDGTSAIDLTSLVNRKYQSQRMSSNPQYANTLSALTDYKPVQLHPTDHWLPQMPVSQAPGVRNTKLWENHFLDLYAPTPPPLLAPIPPQMKRKPIAARKTSLIEIPTAPMPSFLTQGEHVRSLITPILDANQQPIAFHDQASEEEYQRTSRDVDIFAPAHLDTDAEQHHPAVFLEEDTFLGLHRDNPLDQFNVEEMPFPQAREPQFAW